MKDHGMSTAQPDVLPVRQVWVPVEIVLAVKP